MLKTPKNLRLRSFRTDAIAIQKPGCIEIEVVYIFAVLVQEGIKVKILENIHVAIARICEVHRC